MNTGFYRKRNFQAWLIQVFAIGTLILVSTAAAAQTAGLAIQDYTVISSTRINRVVFEYTVQATLVNSSSQTYSQAQATISSTPTNIDPLDDNLSFAAIGPNSTVASTDTFIIRIDRRTPSSLNDLVWEIVGTAPPPPPPPPNPTSGPERAGLFMRIYGPGLEGESTSKSHKDWSDLLAVNEGLENTSLLDSELMRSTGKPHFNEIQVLKYLEKHSPKLRIECARGSEISEVVIEEVAQCEGEGYVRFAISLQNVIISEVTTGATRNTDRLEESLKLSFGSISWLYSPRGPGCKNSGTVTAGWNVEFNQP